MFELVTNGSRRSHRADASRTRRTAAAPAALVELLEPRQMLSAAAPPGLDPRVYAPHATVRGETMAEWSADWWAWAMSIPASSNPLLDTTGAQAPKGDAGKVFFLTGLGFGSPTTSVTRTISMPTGTPALVPVLNSIADETEPDSVGPDHFTVAELRDLAAGFIGTPSTYGPASNTLAASLDGKAITGLAAHREQSPAFSYSIPTTDNLWDLVIPGVTHTTAPAVSDGYWLMLQPLQPGHHTLHVQSSTDGPFGKSSLDFTYKINVIPKGQYNKQFPVTTPPPKATPFATTIDGDKQKKWTDELFGE